MNTGRSETLWVTLTDGVALVHSLVKYDSLLVFPGLELQVNTILNALAQAWGIHGHVECIEALRQN